MKVLVSGGTGLVGRYIVEDLLAAGYAVVIGARHPPVEGLFSQPVEFRPLSLDPQQDQTDAFDDAYFFVHAAFGHLPGKYRGGEGGDPDRFRRLNLDGSIRLFETARQAGVRRVVFLSSRAVYDGLAAEKALTEEQFLDPTSLYGEVKLLAERVLADLSSPGFVTSSLRVTGVYGDARPNKWDALFSDYLAGREVPQRAGSEVHGRDVGQAVRLTLSAEAAKVSGHSFNVSDIVADTRDILDIFQSAVQCPRPLPEPADKMAVRAMPVEKITALGWKPGGRSLFESTVHCLADSY
ncbi:NAD(P)-dependent oxidoreductase [Rhizobium sp. S153]|uniref:NAD(P)-dependent oxidoreductase n=1 Tax=Ciceribacter sichuanensis TaxID=2949647 RepID=A0ABT0V8K0_9HYPH|nr:NAD(P)-dependent oxidoreductase [Ciceribacter sp. S153]MCM2400900.1 NAD(P)-dependent oxidoreductase [Ciceribacter sp. S153]